MAKPKKNGAAAPPVGDNAKAEAELLVHHMTKLRAQKAKVDAAKVILKAEQDDMTALYRTAKEDGFLRKDLAALLEDTGARLRNLLAEEERRFRYRVALGLPVFGQQQDLFGGDETPVEAKDELFWEGEGYLNGRRGAPCEIPEDCPPRFHAAFMRGDAKGQEENGKLLAAGAKRAAVAPKGKVVGDEAQEPGGPTADETAFAPVDRELEAVH